MMTHLIDLKSERLKKSRALQNKPIHRHVTGAVKLRGCGLFILSPAKPVNYHRFVAESEQTEGE